jgi:Raf kinase inhibitor-like YbhB/YbcL family protein
MRSNARVTASPRKSSPSALVLSFLLAGLGACSSSNSSSNDASGSGGRDGGGAGGGGGGALADAGGDTANTLTLSSPGFTAGSSVPQVNTCAGDDTSPELDWTAGPAATASYAVILMDLTNSFIHWVVWDIPPATRSLASMLPATATLTAPAGAKQVHLTVAGAGNGYVGPCPAGALHTYQFSVVALDVATLPGVTTASTSDDVRTAVLAHALGDGTLQGVSQAQMPDAGAGGQ